MRRIDPHDAARAMRDHHVEVSHSCWLARTPEGGLMGCPVGALYYAQNAEVLSNQSDIIDWAFTATGSRSYVGGFDVGFHGFTPLEDPPPEHLLGLEDGQRTRELVDAPRRDERPLFTPADRPEQGRSLGS